MRPRQALFVVGAVLGAGALVRPPAIQADGAKEGAKAGAVDPKADKLLRKMSTELAGMTKFQFDASHVMEVVTKEGEKIQSVAESTVQAQRPNKLRTDRMGPMGGATVYYDGKTISVYGKRDNLYATSKAPDKLDAAIDFARDQLSIDAPGADLLYSNAYEVLMEDVVSGRYLGSEPVGNRVCHHLAYRGNETDWQIWIEDGPRALPCRFVINSKKEQGSPEYVLSTSNWKAEPPFPAGTFAFKPPPDARKINFVRVADVKEQQKKGEPQKKGAP